MEKIRLLCYLILGMCSFQACQSPESKSAGADDSTVIETKTVDSGNTKSGKTGSYESKADDDEAYFIKNASVGGMMEVESAQLALKNASNASVKNFAQQILTDHGKANSELKGLAKKFEIIIPSEYPSDQKSHLDMMKKMKGTAFDKHYIDMMIGDHAKTLELFKSAQSSESNEISDFAAKTLPVLEGHSEMAKKIKTEIN